jgi:hypothetical protein
VVRHAPARFVALLVTLGVGASAVPVHANPSGGALPPQLTLVVHVAGTAGVPGDAVGAAMNVTVTEPGAPGYLTVYPCGDRPLASNLNYVAGQTVPNFVIAGLDVDGDVCIDTIATTDVIVDIAGYIPPGSPVTPLPQPQRFLDTREGVGAPKARVAGLGILAVPIAGSFGVPPDAATVVFNATAVQPSGDGFLTVFPCGEPIPETSSLNFTAGTIVPNLVVSRVGAGGQVCFLSNVESDIVADVAAYVGAGADDVSMLDRPHRLVDTRIGLGGPATPVGPPTRVVAVTGQFGVPAGATAAIVNLTATNGIDAGYAAAFPCGGGVPLVSNLNFTAGADVANLAIVPLAGDGTLCLTANRDVDLIVDVLGYTDGTDAITPVLPTRVYDSREEGQPVCHIAVRLNGGTFELIAGGAANALPAQPTYEHVFEPQAYIGPDCTVYLVGSVAGQYRIDEYTPTGVHLGGYGTTYLPGTSNARPADLDATVYGLIGLSARDSSNPAKVVVFDTGATIFTLPDDNLPNPDGSLNSWEWIGATDDAQIVALSRRLPFGLREVTYWSADGVLFFSVLLPSGAVPMDISPSGDYISYRSGGGGLGPQTLEVATLDGSVVARLPDGGDPTWFMADGAVAACQRAFGGGTERSVDWRLFSAPMLSWNVAPAPVGCSVVAGR